MEKTYAEHLKKTSNVMPLYHTARQLKQAKISARISFLKQLSVTPILSRDFYKIARSMGLKATFSWDKQNRLPVFMEEQNEIA